MTPLGGAVALTLAAVGSALAQAPAPAEIARRPELSRRIDSLYAPYTRPGTVGGVVVVIHRGEVIHLKGYGAAQREFGVPWTPDTRYRLASITKSLVATAVLRLEDQGKLRLTDPVKAHLPEFPDVGAPVTIDHLLTMSSGLWQDESLLALAGLRGSLTVDEMFQLTARQRALNFPPGSSMAYTDANYRILARLIAAVTGQPFARAMQGLVFQPLGMTATLTDPSLHHFYANQAPTYLGGQDDPPALVNVPFHTSGDGSVITTMRDFIQWLLELRRDHDRPGSLFERMTRSFSLGDGMPAAYRRGIAAFLHRGLIGWAHGGFTGTHYVFYPELDLMIANFTNQLGGLAPIPVDAAVTDLFLASQGYPSGDVSQALAKVEPATGPVPAAEARLLSGVFVEPRSGYVLTADPPAGGGDQPFVRYDFLGTEVRVAKGADGRFMTPALQRGARVTITLAPCGGCPEPDLDVRQAGWPAARRFHRVVPGRAAPASTKEYLGVYHLVALDTYYTVGEGRGGSVLRIASGVQGSQVIPLTPLGPDLFRGQSADGGQFDLYALGTVSVKFVRGRSGRVAGIRFSVDRVRDLDLVKVR
ncbi:MAG: serine hydrolase domain-containing protein [Gemmatimonadales bacterium]|nr:serine hydrolase domain-containing protein [Gemmatimonadales bacterium]